MKYMFINDFRYILKRYLLFYFLFMIIMIAFPFFLKYVLEVDFNNSFILNLFLFNIGEKYSFFSVFEFMIYILNICFYSFFAIDIFLKDIALGKENVFLRISPLKWMSYKLIIILFYTSLFYIIQFSLLYFIYTIYGFELVFQNISRLIFSGLFLKILLEIINIIFLLIFRKNYFLLVIILYAVPWIIHINSLEKCISFLFIDIYIENSLVISIVVMVVVTILASLIFNLCKKRLMLQFEGSI